MINNNNDDTKEYQSKFGYYKNIETKVYITFGVTQHKMQDKNKVNT